MTIHELKTLQPHFDAIELGEKRAELRRDDRGFEVGDTLVLREYDPQSGYSGRSCRAKVTHILAGFEALVPGHVMMSIELELPADAPHHCVVCEQNVRAGLNPDGTERVCHCGEGPAGPSHGWDFTHDFVEYNQSATRCPLVTEAVERAVDRERATHDAERERAAKAAERSIEAPVRAPSVPVVRTYVLTTETTGLGWVGNDYYSDDLDTLIAEAMSKGDTEPRVVHAKNVQIKLDLLDELREVIRGEISDENGAVDDLLNMVGGSIEKAQDLIDELCSEISSSCYAPGHEEVELDQIDEALARHNTSSWPKSF